MRVARKDGLWLIAILAVCALVLGRLRLFDRTGSQDPHLPLTICGVRPGDSMAYVRQLWPNPDTVKGLVWSYGAITVMFDARDGQVDVVTGGQLETRRGAPFKTWGDFQNASYTWSDWMEHSGAPLDSLDARYNPRSSIQPPAADGPCRWVIYPRFCLRVDLMPTRFSSDLVAVNYTLSLTERRLYAPWQWKDVPAVDRRHALQADFSPW